MLYLLYQKTRKRKDFMATTLAHRMRPTSLKDVLGQKHIIGENALFTQFVKKHHPMSTILYGPPGCGNK